MLFRSQASTLIQSSAHEDANIIFGAVLDETMGDEVKITVIATGFREEMPERRERMLQGTAALPASRVETPAPPPPPRIAQRPPTIAQRTPRGCKIAARDCTLANPSRGRMPTGIS